MVPKMSSIQFHAESMFFPLTTYSRSRSSPVSYMQNSAFGHNNRLRPRLCFFIANIPSARKMKWSVNSMTDGSSSSDPSESNSSGGTRLVRAIQLLQTKLGTRIKDLRKGLSLKIFFFLVGFYCATAFATVIGQTGDWGHYLCQSSSCSS